MASSNPATSDYTVRDAASLLGLTEDAIRKRVLAGTLDGHVDQGVFVVSAEAVESARQKLLGRLNAVDARAGAHDARGEELERLREEVVRYKAALQSMIQAQAHLNDAIRAQLDTVQQFALPASPRSLMDVGSE
jgi:hypothetical protein